MRSHVLTSTRHLGHLQLLLRQSFCVAAGVSASANAGDDDARPAIKESPEAKAMDGNGYGGYGNNLDLCSSFH